MFIKKFNVQLLIKMLLIENSMLKNLKIYSQIEKIEL